MPQARYYSSTAVKTSITASITNSATTIPVGSTAGFPTSFPYTLILEDGTANQEAVTVTAASSLNLTAIRGVDGTSALPHSAGATAGCGFTARDFSEPQAHIAATSGVHGVVGTLVGTSDAQTLSNKTLSSPVLNTPDIENGGTLTLPTGPDTLVARTSTDTLTNKTLTSPVINTPTISGATETGSVLDSTSTIDGITGAQIAADHATTAANAGVVSGLATPLTGHLTSILSGSGGSAQTVFSISLGTGTWLVNVGVAGATSNTAVNGSDEVTDLVATATTGIALSGKLRAKAVFYGPNLWADMALTCTAVVGTAGTVTISTSAMTTNAQIEGGVGLYCGYTALKVA